MSSSRLNPRSTLWIASLVLLILSLLPAKIGGWVGWFERPLNTLLSPVQAPIAGAVRAVRGSSQPGESSDPVVARMQLELDIERQRRLAAEGTVEDLQRQIADLRGALGGTDPDLSVSRVMAPVIGPGSNPSSTAMKVRAGTRQGVQPGSVCVVKGVQLVGRVFDAAERYSWVMPITERGADPVAGVIMLPGGNPGPRCPQLTPVGDGTLRGRVEDDADYSAGNLPRIEKGMLVRLRDDTWPSSASMMIIGEVEKVEPAPDSPLRQIVTVRPQMDISRVSEVMLLAAGPADEETGGKGERP